MFSNHFEDNLYKLNRLSIGVGSRVLGGFVLPWMWTWNSPMIHARRASFLLSAIAAARAAGAVVSKSYVVRWGWSGGGGVFGAGWNQDWLKGSWKEEKESKKAAVWELGRCCLHHKWKGHGIRVGPNKGTVGRVLFWKGKWNGKGGTWWNR